MRQKLDDIKMQAMRGKVAGSAAYNFSNKDVHFDLTGESIDLADIPELQQPRLQVAGVGRFTAKGAGTLEQPVINAHLQVSDLVLNGEKFGGVTADAVTHGSHLATHSAIEFSCGPLGG